MDNELERLISYIAKLPGLGKRSARRIALNLLKNKDSLMLPLASSLAETAEKIVSCKHCGNYDVSDPCNICEDDKRLKNIICVVEDVSDLWALERGGIYKGQYHVLGGVLSAVDGVGPEDLKIDKLLDRINQNPEINEIILATNATLDGQTTAHYINRQLEGKVEKITRLTHGIPLGGELEYLDEGTLSTALETRREIA